MKISRREKTLLLIAVYLLIIFGGYKLIISPTRAKLAEVKTTNSQIDQAVQNAVQGGKQKDESESVISKELASYMKLEEQLPQDKQLVELVDQIGTMADENKVTLSSVNYTDSKAKTAEQKVADQTKSNENQATVTGASKMELTLSITGSYYHLLGFLQDLGKSPRIIVVNSATMSVGQKKEVPAGTVSGSSGSYTSSNPPPTAPLAKGTRVQTSVSTGGSVPVQTTVSEPVVPEMTKYDLSNIQMNLQITSFYDSTQAEIEKLLGTTLFKKLTGEGSTSQTDENLTKVAAAVKKYWDKDDPAADWSNSRDPGDDCWNGKLLKYLEGKYNNTNMGKNIRGLVNPLAEKINPDSEWAGTAILHWDKLLDLNMTSIVKPIDPDTDKTYSNVKTRDFLPAAVYITYLPNYAPDKVEKLSKIQIQAVMGTIIVWQAKDSKNAPVVYRIDDKGKVQDLQKIE